MHVINTLKPHILLLSCCFLLHSTYSAHSKFIVNLKPQVSAEEQIKAAGDVIKRIAGDKADFFRLKIDINYPRADNDMFRLRKIDGKIEITANNGLSLVWGFHYYIKSYCYSHIGWKVRQITIPKYLPDVDIKVVAKDKLRYYQNVCTTSYSFVWWNLTEWQSHIDWMALNGMNLALAPHGQEAIWQRVYEQLNLTVQEIDDHFTGPAFLSWQRMGNIRHWGGPLSFDWHQRTLSVQKFVVNSMRNLGMIPALPAFAGFVPLAFKRLFPGTNFSTVGSWNNFDADNCCPLFVPPTDPLFNKIGKLFLTEMTKEFGYSHVYYSDSFNEISPTSDDLSFISNVGRNIYKAMSDVDPNSIWLLQNWMLVNNPPFWTVERTKSFITSVPIGRLLILDLQSEQWPQYDKHNMYYGQPFIWCMLHNFGGTLGMFGDSHSINNDVFDARKRANSTMIGIGLTPEGINQNYVMYDLFLESALRDKPVDLNVWSKNYAIRRYGGFNSNAEAAWTVLLKSVYNFVGLNRMRGKYVITRRPNLTLKPWAWYSSADLIKAWELLLAAQSNLYDSDGYQHDLVDLTRQVLQYRGDQIYPVLMNAYNNRDVHSFNNYTVRFLEIFADLETVLASHKNFLLGNWLESAKNAAASDKDRILFEYNARNQITLWGPDGQIVDYANKQWAGLMNDYYGMRWTIFLSEIQYSLANNIPFNKSRVVQDIFKNVEQPFTTSNKIYPTYPIDDPVTIAQRLFYKWSHEDLPDVPISTISKRSKREFHEITEDEPVYVGFPNVVLV